MKQILFFTLVILLGGTSAHAQKNAADLKKIEATLKTEEEHKKALVRKEAEIEKKLGTVQESLVKVTQELRAMEDKILQLREAHTATQNDILLARETLENEREVLADLILALQRLSRMPPEALLARPTAPVDTARSYGLLQNILPVISEKASEVSETIANLEILYEEQEKQEKTLVIDQLALEKKRAGLNALLEERKSLLKVTQSDQKKAEEKAKALALKAKDLRDLFAELARQAAVKVEPTPPPKPELEKIFVRKSVFTPLPVAGWIETAFGQKISGGGTSQGLRIATSLGAVVTSPASGVVRFAGPFRQYKLLVIIQHENGEHSLLGGLQELYTKVGSQLVKGEPVGKLPEIKMKGDSSPGTSLYYERRRNGKPVDPSNLSG